MAGYEHEAPFDSGMLPVSSIHQLYYEQYGKKNGKPGTSRLPIELERI
jgi:proline iminopeptidase